MKAYNDFRAEKASSGREILPAGGYVCTVKSVKIDEYHNDFGDTQYLVLAIDVSEGQFAGFFEKDYKQNTNDDKKWRGTYRIRIPSDDGTEQDSWTKRTFGNFIWAVQESNPGYTWSWDEKTLKGKKLGVLYRNKEWEYNGKTGWTTEAAGSASVDDIRAGNFKPLKDKPLKDKPLQTAPQFTEEPAGGSDDLPF